MANIDISHPHERPFDQTRQAIERMADKLRTKYGMKTQWEQESLLFSGTGIDGRIDLLPRQVRVTAQLGFLMAALKNTIETEIQRALSENLG